MPLPPRATRIPNRIGIRQPYSITALGDSVVFTIRPAAEPSSVPAKQPNGLQAPINPRFPGTAPSTRNTDDAMYSPPTASPCSSRNTSSSAGAASPMVASLGSSPMQNDGRAMARTDQSSACLRPNLSPIWPKKAPPIGRMRNPAANVPYAASSDAVGLVAG